MLFYLFSCLLFLRLFCLSMFWIVCCDFVAAKITNQRRPKKSHGRSAQKRYAQLFKLTPLTTLPQQISAHACAAAHSMSISSLYPCASAHFTRSHTSVSILDGLLSIKIPKIEVHISNLFSREEFRQHSYLSRGVDGFICGFGINGYALAIQGILKII